MTGFQKTNCVFQCAPRADDSLEHYCRCPVLVRNLGLAEHALPIDQFFAVVKGLTDQEKLAIVRKLHAVLRLVHFARLHGSKHDWKLVGSLEIDKTL